ncbi:MAG: hypothetical protein ACM3S4_14040 [Burkholderiales bacterium]
MNLYDAFKAMPDNRWKYYYDTRPLNFDDLNEEEAYKFIRGNYTLGAKDKVFDIGFHDRFKEKGKHRHTVALYFLGCYLSAILSDTFRNHLEQFIDNIDGNDFQYIWYLSCLYHDTASILEESEYNRSSPRNLSFYLGKYNISHNVYTHIWKEAKPYTYSEELVKNYFTYRVEYGHRIDHGIIAGYLIYDRLRKNYDANWAEFKLKRPNDGKYEDFSYKNLRWNIQHHSYFAYVANTIIAHNIWYSEDTPNSIQTYRQYGLDPLIYNKSNRINLKKDPLVFFLGFLDSIEPVKFFNTVDAKIVWKAIEIIYDSNTRKLHITTDGSLLNTNVWFNKIEGMSNWLNVEVESAGTNGRIITINI